MTDTTRGPAWLSRSSEHSPSLTALLYGQWGRAPQPGWASQPLSCGFWNKNLRPRTDCAGHWGEGCVQKACFLSDVSGCRTRKSRQKETKTQHTAGQWVEVGGLRGCAYQPGMSKRLIKEEALGCPHGSYQTRLGVQSSPSRAPTVSSGPGPDALMSPR